MEEVIKYWESMGMSKLIKSIEKTGEHQVRISLSEPNAPFLSNLAMSFMSVLSKEYADYLLTKNEKEKIDHFPHWDMCLIFLKNTKKIRSSGITLIRNTSRALQK